MFVSHILIMLMTYCFHKSVFIVSCHVVMWVGRRPPFVCRHSPITCGYDLFASDSARGLILYYVICFYFYNCSSRYSCTYIVTIDNRFRYKCFCSNYMKFVSSDLQHRNLVFLLLLVSPAYLGEIGPQQ